ncbi:MAG: glycosyltransferase family 4 protein [Methyloceanibacter sp.]|uniref:glycosyltransferase family 4 protein n=1 Tax=Methyloceanibacter sp. TaxID=1965321 RepID=UPI003D9BE705
MSPPLRILHCLRTPIGGLFRHVYDLARDQAELGLEVGVICDATAAGEGNDRALVRLADACALGVTRVAMPRQLGFGDWGALGRVTRLADTLDIDILHGHGAKGGAYGRLAVRSLKRKGREIKAIYTPHGGSLHFSPTKPLSRLYIAAERRLAPLTDGLIFESVFASRRYTNLIGAPRCPVRIVPNGVHPQEFYEPMLADDAADFVFVGELRHLKGVDVFLEALAADRDVFPGRAIVVGSGPDEAAFKKLARKLRLGATVSFIGAQPRQSAFSRARCLVPSRAESFPYIVLEAAAAGMPIIATNVGGIPEIVSGTHVPLIPPGDAKALAGQMRAFLADPQPFLARAAELKTHVGEKFTVEIMTRDVVDFYDSCLDAAPRQATILSRTRSSWPPRNSVQPGSDNGCLMKG